MSNTKETPKRLFFLIRVRKDISTDDFERFIATDVLPRVRKLESVISYQVNRIEGYTFDNERREDLPCDYVDVVDVTSVDRYVTEITALLDGDWGKSFALQWDRYVLEDFPVYGTPFDAPPMDPSVSAQSNFSEPA